jgi:hypothetical protein
LEEIFAYYLSEVASRIAMNTHFPHAFVERSQHPGTVLDTRVTTNKTQNFTVMVGEYRLAELLAQPSTAFLVFLMDQHLVYGAQSL